VASKHPADKPTPRRRPSPRPSEPQIGQLLTYRDLGELLRWHKITVLRKKAAGLLPPHIVVAGTHRWRRDVILRWIESGCPESMTLGKLKG
jgi:hypothetical protein